MKISDLLKFLKTWIHFLNGKVSRTWTSKNDTKNGSNESMMIPIPMITLNYLDQPFNGWSFHIKFIVKQRHFRFLQLTVLIQILQQSKGPKSCLSKWIQMGCCCKNSIFMHFRKTWLFHPLDGYRSHWFSLSIRWGASWKLLPTNHCTQSIPSISCSCQSNSLIQLSLWGVASSPQAKQLLSKLCSHLSISFSQAPAVHHISILTKDLILYAWMLSLLLTLLQPKTYEKKEGQNIYRPPKAF